MDYIVIAELKIILLLLLLFSGKFDADNSDQPVGVSKVCDGADDNEACQTWTG